jgi:hypothetical protein
MSLLDSTPCIDDNASGRRVEDPKKVCQGHSSTMMLEDKQDSKS